MIKFERFELKNGLKVLVHKDMATPMAVVNIMYNVGARDENPEKTGFPIGSEPHSLGRIATKGHR